MKSEPTADIKPTVEKPQFELLHDLAVMHTAALNQQRERKNLVENIGPFRRALCARRDLMIRRKLCRAGKVRERKCRSVKCCEIQLA